MEAGKPYIFRAPGSTIHVDYTSSDVEETAGSNNGLYGFYDLNDDEAIKNLTQDAGNYILYQNQYLLVSGRGAYIANYRAYIKLGEISTTKKSAAPGRRRVALGAYAPSTATALDNAEASEKPMKLMINGQLFIIRGEKMYDATGKLVK